MPSEAEYVLKVGKEGAPRLKLLNEMCNPSSMEFIEANIDLKNKRILDLGCGIGIFSSALAIKSLPKGNVVAADISQAQLDIAATIAKENKIENISFKQISAFDIDKLDFKFDIIFCRFVLAHLSSVTEVINKITKLMHPDSFLICEEPNSVDSLYCKPTNDTFDKWKRAAVMQVEISKANFSIGESLHSIFAINKLQTTKKRKAQAVLNTPELKQQLWLGVLEISSLLVNSGFSTADELQELVHSLKDFANNSDSNVGYLECTQIAAKLEDIEERTVTNSM